MGGDLRCWVTVFSNEMANSSYQTHPYPRLQHWNFSDWIHTKVLPFHSNCFKHDVYFSGYFSSSPIHLILSVIKKTKATFKTSFTWKALPFNPHPALTNHYPGSPSQPNFAVCSMESFKWIILKTILGFFLDFRKMDPPYSKWGLNPLLKLGHIPSYIYIIYLWPFIQRIMTQGPSCGDFPKKTLGIRNVAFAQLSSWDLVEVGYLPPERRQPILCPWKEESWDWLWL